MIRTSSTILFVGVVGLAIAACSGNRKPDDGPIEQESTAPEEAASSEPAEYVVVHRNTPIRLAPSADAPALQYRPPERQLEFDERRASEAAERAERAAEAEEERIEREKERAARLKKRRRKLSWKRRKELRERDAERAEEQRRKRAERKLRDARRRAKSARNEAPDREWIPFRRVATSDGWVELSPVHRTDDPPHCYARNFGEVDRLDATFWVLEDELAQVVTHRVRVAAGNGTEVILLPGVALEPAGDERFTVYVDGFELLLSVPPDSVGYSYRPMRQFEAPLTDTVFTPIALAEGELRLGSTSLPYNPYRPLFVTGTLFIGNRFYVTTQTPCAEVTVRATEDLIEPAGRRGAMRLSPDDDAVSPPLARRGSTAYLPNGREFARVRADFPLGNPTTEVDGRSCYRSRVWGDSDAAVSRSLELCFEPDALILEAE